MSRKMTASILKSLRHFMVDKKIVSEPIQAYIVPSGDAHQNEYISPCDARRDYVTGFTGSAGTAVVTACSAALWVDGRYHIQAEDQTDDNWIVMKEGLKGTPTIPEWLSKLLGDRSSRVGVDPGILSAATWSRLDSEFKDHGCELVPISSNLVDLIWENRPEQPSNPLIILDIKYAGETWQSKIDRLRENMAKNKADACLLTALDDISWLLNMRGSDIPCNPVFYSYVIVTKEYISLFIDESKMTESVRRHLTSEEDNSYRVQIFPIYEFYNHVIKVTELVPNKIWVNKKASQKVHDLVPKEKRYVTQYSHVYGMKAVKNGTEIEGMRRAHYKDAVTLCEFFSWIEEEIRHNSITESEAADKLEAIKRNQDDFMSLSFETISSSGPNAAINHYRAIPGQDRAIDNQGIFLLDSGAQYMDGTTDVTRTVHFGAPSDYQRECYTRVLKGHIQLANAVWPRGIKGHMLDSFARMHLWAAGLNYRHGTGHGVGAFLNVHEGPCAISHRQSPGEADLEPGMILSNEPGYYEDGDFGIRIENCMLIIEADTKYNFDKTGYLSSEPLTLVPISTKLVDPSLLSESEINWLNSYHSKCREVIGPMLKSAGKEKALRWLLLETEPLG